MIAVCARIRVYERETKKFGIIVPLLPLWIILLCILVPIYPFVVIAAPFMGKVSYRRLMLYMFPLILSAACSLPGFSMCVGGRERTVQINIK